MFSLGAALPHAWARDPSRQLEIAVCRCQLFLSFFCAASRAVQAVLQQPADVFVTCLIIFWRQFDEYSSSCWSVEVRPSHVDECHNLSSTFTRGDLRQHYFQRLQRRRRRVQLLPRVRLVFLLEPPRAHVGLPWLSLVNLRSSCLDGCPLRLSQARLSGDSRVHRHDECTPLLHVLPWRTPQAEQFLLIVMHGFPHCILHVTRSFVVMFVNNPAYPPCILCFLGIFPHLQLLLILSQLFSHCSGNLTYPSSCLFPFLDCVVRVNTSVSMRACAFVLHLHSNLSRVGDRPYTCVDKSCSSCMRPIRTCTDPPLSFSFLAWP